MSRGMTRAERLQEMERIYTQHQGGLTDIEMAERLGVDRTTVYRDRVELETRVPFREVEPGRWAIDRMKYLSSIRVNLTEALALYLAARRTSRHTRTHQAHVVSALEKLATALKQPMTEHLVKAAASIAGQDLQPERLTILETLARGWAEQIKVRITHRALSARRSMTYVISPYLIEPSLWSDGAYVIGHSDVHNDVATFKIERIEHASLTTERFTPPVDFDEQELLRFAWGIWTSDEEPVTVRLKFTGQAAVRRLKESIWHPLQEIHDNDDGSCIWEAQVAEPREMVPWVRGWGASVEVLEPEEMREALVREVRRMARVYGVGYEPSPPRYQLLWAKLSRNKACSHPLICHLLDVAEVTQALWRDALTAGQRAHWAAALGLDDEAAGRLLAFWAGLHDLGKASPAFQRQWREAELLLSAAGLPFPQRFVDEFCPHGRITTATLPTVLSAETGLPPRAAARVARAVGGHHGAWPTPNEEQDVKSDERGGAEWDDVRRELLRVLQGELQPPTLTAWPLSRATDNTFLTWFSGLVSVADWLGSVEEYFPYIEAPLDPAQYAQQAAAQAQTALQSLHWTDWQPPTAALPFAELFPFPPSPMQQAVIDLVAQIDQPALVLIEAPTGSGKTEAALYLADAWARTLQQRGMYVAMPTMATSNQMWERVGEFLRRRYPQSDLKPLLIHSQARWVKPPPEATLQDETEESVAAALAWFLPRKRSLLAPCAVGTVDQALMCVLQARHFFVRLFGLSEKTVIFDEIHAYDTYMSTLFQRLLDWLRAMGASAVLLSATLPAQTRRELLEAYAGRPVDLPPVEYPAIIWATAEDGGIVPLPKPENRPVALQWLSREPGAVVDALRAALREGGCAAVICNTVARAQEVYLALKEAHLVPDDALTLFHARYPFAWRDEIEKGVLARFGKEVGMRPQRAIVVATQVLEQSLDLDFDVMVSDLAPVDLLVQRAGRLHRHPGRTRPAPVAEPCLYVAVDAAGDAAPDFGRDVYVYAPYLLLRAYLVLRGRDALTLPGDVTGLIEAGYGDEPLPGVPPTLAAALNAARQDRQRTEDKDEFEARNRLVGKPTFDGLLNETAAGLEEDAPDVHAALQALTRLGPPTISLVCLHETSAGLNTKPDGSGASIALDFMPDAETTKALARATVGVSNRATVNHFRAQEPPAAWRKHPLLRDHRVAVFVNGVYTCSSHTLYLSRELGLQVDPERHADQKDTAQGARHA